MRFVCNPRCNAEGFYFPKFRFALNAGGGACFTHFYRHANLPIDGEARICVSLFIIQSPPLMTLILMLLAFAVVWIILSRPVDVNQRSSYVALLFVLVFTGACCVVVGELAKTHYNAFHCIGALVALCITACYPFLVAEKSR